MSTSQATGRGRGRPAASATGVHKTASSKSGKVSTTTTASRGGAGKKSAPRQSNEDIDPFADSQPEQDDQMDVVDEQEGDNDQFDLEERKIIPPELLTRLLNEFFEKDGTRISKDANKAVAKYMDVFVREAIARCVVERDSGFLEVEDLEKVAPQLLLDL